MQRFLILVLMLMLLASTWLTGPLQSLNAETIHFGELLPAAEAAATMRVPEGFRVTLFAGEPDVQQPIGFCIDDRGRLWVAEAYNYPHHGTRPGDRIVILEDVDGDGRFDRRKIFYDQLNYVTGIEVGFGGVWVMSPPNFYFIPDRDQDGQPDGPPQVLLDGFGNHANAHNLANGLAWGPDGWLYGTHGRTNWSLLGKPGTPDGERQHFDGGVYRYHPVRHVWEPYADGTTNPWGIDWNDYGEAFITNCVNPHVFHVIHGAHYEPWRNRESSRFAYQRIPTIADHQHFVSVSNTRDSIGSTQEDATGGGHAHCGTMVYLGDNWPSQYRNTLFTNNVHGRRINNDLLDRRGSSYCASHGPDLMVAQDPWFIGVTLAYGPGGEVYVIDWSDTGECHNVVNTQRQTGRIYRITFGDVSVPRVDVSARANTDLVDLQSHANDWYVRHARRLLHERAASGRDMSKVHEGLHNMFAQQSNVPRKLRALWALYVTGGLDDDFLVDLLGSNNEYIRAWAVRLLCEDGTPPTEAMREFERLAADGDSMLVRLHLASTLQRLPPHKRWPVAEALAGRASDAQDPSLPLMLWYAIEPLVDDDLNRYVLLAARAQLPRVRQNMARRVVEQREANDGLMLLVDRLDQESNSHIQSDLVTGMLKGLEGRRTVAQPKNWSTCYAKLTRSGDARVPDLAQRLALVFDDPVAIQQLTRQATNLDATRRDRRRAVESLIGRRPSGFEVVLLQLVADPVVRDVSLRGLAQYNHPDTARIVMRHYSKMNAESRQHALQTLASRTGWASRLLDAVESQLIDSQELTAYTIRQIQSLGSRSLDQRVHKLWGEVRTTSEERRREIARLRHQLLPEALKRADVTSGRVVFQRHCGTCHRFFGDGGEIGPDITGAQRTNLDYLLENIVDPSAVVSHDYCMQIIETADGRVLTGLVKSENEYSLTLLTVNDRIVVPVSEIESRDQSRVSIMPDGLLKTLTGDEIRDLIAYLQSDEVALQRSKTSEH